MCSSDLPHYRMNAKCTVAIAFLAAAFGAVLGDGAGHGGGHQHAPAPSGYAAPAQSSGYAAPAQSGYGGYETGATGYDAPAYDYGYQAPEESGLDLSKLEELLPLFLAVLAAIILAQLLLPFLSQIFVVLIGLLPMALNIKAPIINAILGPFGLTLCSPTNPPTVFPAAGRSMGEEFGLSPETAQILQDTFSTVVETIQSQYM